MRIALLGWDLDRPAIDALARLGAEPVVFTRWHSDEPEREAHPGWLEIRCPHAIGGGPHEESLAFGVAAVRAASTSGVGFDFDVFHALDWWTRPAAGELASRSPGEPIVVGSDRAEDEDADDPGFGPRCGPDAWICDHPWIADRLKSAEEARVFWAPTQAGLAYWRDREPTVVGNAPDVVLAIGTAERFSPDIVVRALGLARERRPGLTADVLGTGPRTSRLRTLLAADGLLARRVGETFMPGPGQWNGAVSRARVLGTAARDLVDDPFARAAAMLGTPAVSLGGRDADRIAGDLLDALFDRERSEARVRIAAALESRRVDLDGVAAEWIGIYRRLLARRTSGSRNGSPSKPDPCRPLAFPEMKSRLTLTALSSREALASWSVFADDWRVALEWLGPEASRAVLTIRLFDVTDVKFDGLNAHGSTDVDLGPGEKHRTIALPFDGRSLAAALGVRSRWGYFHPLAFSRICQLPREGTAPAWAGRRLRVIPGRGEA